MNAKHYALCFLEVAVYTFVLCGLARPAPAAVRTWDDGSGNHQWYTTTNWNPDGTPADADTLRILLANANVQSASYVYVSNGGSIEINAANASVSFTSYFYCGLQGTGTLTISQGSLSTSSVLALGFYPGSLGIANLSGSSSSWTTNGTSMSLGGSGAGEMTISNGADLSTGYLMLGTNGGSSGTLVLQDAGSTLSSGNIAVGNYGAGTLTVSRGADVTSTSVDIGNYGSAANGSATIDGSGSTWNTANYSFTVGNQGTGTLHISGGGSLTTSYGYVGIERDSQGTVLLEDVGSTWNLGDTSLYVAYSGIGSLTINDGASVSSGNGYVGGFGSAQGTVTVDGYDSRWLVDHSAQASWLYVGNGGSSTLTVSNRGRVYVDGTLWIGAYGTVNLSGGELEVDTLGGEGRLNFSSGTLEVTAGGATIGGGQPLGNSVSLNAGSLLSASAGITVESGSLLNINGGDVQASALDNYGIIYISADGTITTTSFDLTNHSYLSMNNGTITGNGAVLNDHGATFIAGGTITRPLDNYGVFSLSGYLSVGGAIINYGVLNTGSKTLSLSANLLSTGTIELSGGGIIGGPIANDVTGILRGSGSISSSVDNSGLIHASTAGATLGLFGATGNSSTGELRVEDDAKLSIQTAFTNYGLIDLGGAGAVFSGGTITNLSTIQGAGRLTNNIANNSVIRAAGGPLTLVGTATNAATGRLEIADGSTLLVALGLSPNVGQMTLDGGTFDNNGRTITNAATGTILGHGTFRSGGLTNQGNVSFADYSSVIYGSVLNKAGAKLFTYGTPGTLATFFGPVTNDAGGEIKINGGVVRFLGGLANSGIYTSDPADNYIHNLAVTATGILQGGNGDRFFISGIFTNAGTILLGDGSAAVVQNGMGNLVQTGGTLTIGNGATLDANILHIDGGTIAAGGPTALIAANLDYASSSNSTFAGNLGGLGKTVTLNSPPTTKLILTSANSYTGATTVESGILELLAQGQIAESSGVTTSAAGIFQIGLGTHHVKKIDGQGTTNVIAGGLTTGSIVQGTLNIGIPPGAVNAVPEPGTMALLAFAALMAIGIRKSRK
ncbi:MAG: PEP-CTERM sorting domain-containing protein [Pirellulales bacterium]|nr:PEP-CTERM sorting domain-containing protein [Pirellulales bacterium]